MTETSWTSRLFRKAIEAPPVDREPQPKPQAEPIHIPSIQAWLRSGQRGASRKVSFTSAPYTHGAINCDLFETFDGASRSAEGSGTTDGDAFLVAMARWIKAEEARA